VTSTIVWPFFNHHLPEGTKTALSRCRGSRLAGMVTKAWQAAIRRDERRLASGSGAV